MSHNDHLYKLFIISFFKHPIYNQLSAATATGVAPVVSDKGQSLFVLYISFIHSYNYGVIYFLLAQFLSIICSNAISTNFSNITENKVSLFFDFDQKKSRIRLVLFFE